MGQIFFYIFANFYLLVESEKKDSQKFYLFSGVAKRAVCCKKRDFYIYDFSFPPLPIRSLSSGSKPTVVAVAAGAAAVAAAATVAAAASVLLIWFGMKEKLTRTLFSIADFRRDRRSKNGLCSLHDFA